MRTFLLDSFQLMAVFFNDVLHFPLVMNEQKQCLNECDTDNAGDSCCIQMIVEDESV